MSEVRKHRARKADLVAGDQVGNDARSRDARGEEARQDPGLREGARTARVRTQSQRLAEPANSRTGQQEKEMPIETATGTSQCPECFADVTLTKVMQNEI